MPTQVDPQLFNRFDKGTLVGQMSGHIDDLKGTADEPIIKELIDDLEKRYGKLKVQRGNFEHVGIQHCKQSDGSYVLHQHHYVEQLRPMGLDSMKALDVETDAPEHMIGPYVSLTCAMAWVLVTAPVIAVYIGALQRHLKAPKVKHLFDANRVLRYLKLRKPKLVHRALKGLVRLVVVADAAFAALDTEGLALRGYFILLISDAGNGFLGGLLHILDYISRKQQHVCRSTFAAELFALLDACGAGSKVLLCLEESITGPQSATELAREQDNSELAINMEAVTDAKSVFDVVVNVKAVRASEVYLLIHILKLRELIRLRVLKKLWWTDTRDMITDGLTKGSVDRTAILAIAEKGVAGSA